MQNSRKGDWMERALKKYILKDLAKKMVFLVGPRQVGKTWLSKQIMQKFKTPRYLNYDDLDDKKIIQEKLWPRESDLVVFDEIHKMPQWKNFLKGVFDTKTEWQTFLVTGSARLETFRNSGDSLAGRFFSHRLFPFTLNEIPSPSLESMEKLLKRGGFPEPFLSENVEDADRWRMQYIDGLIRTDILDFDKINDFKAIQQVLKLLKRAVGSTISYTSLARDVQVAPNTIKKYIEIFESLFIIFKVIPYSKNIVRSILKGPKIYFFDTGLVEGDEGAIFENFVALELFKRQQSIVDLKGKSASLNYLRTKEKKEVDFCLVENQKVIAAIEVKLSDKNISKELKSFVQKYQFQGIQLVKNLQNEYDKEGIKVRNAFDFLKNLDETELKT